MRAVDRFRHVKRAFVLGTKVMATAACCAGIGLFFFGLGSSDQEEKELEEASTLSQDGATYKLAGDNAVSMEIYIDMNPPGNDNRKKFHDAYIFDMDDKTVIRAPNEKAENPAPSNLPSFETFNNPLLIERVRLNGCTIAHNIAAHPNDSTYRVKQRKELKDRAQAFIINHCPQ